MAVKDIKQGEKSFRLSYEIVNPKKENAILFLHGWGSRKEIMKQAFGKSFKEYRHIYLDMPGFGKSGNDYILQTRDYKEIVQSFLDSISEEPSVIFGHSFGGKVAALLAPETLVLLSSAGIVEKKPLKVRLKIALFKLLKPFGGKKLARVFATKDVSGMNRNMYETLKNVVNEDFREYFKAFQNRALIFWGKEDRATSLKSGEKIASLIERSKFFPLEGDHYFFLTKENSEFIEKSL